MVRGTRCAFAVVLALVCAGARAQNTSAVCSGDFAWASNNLNQSPCIVSSYLLLPCTPTGANVNALPSPGLSYITPSDSAGPFTANQCTCSTVTFNAIQACAVCQGGKSVSWTAWRSACTDDEISIGSYPKAVDSGTLIPRWMFDDVLDTDGFDETAAEKVAASALPDAGVGAPPAPATSAVSPTTDLGTVLGPTSAPKSKSNSVPLFAIIAGAIGGIAVLLIVAIVVTCLVRRSRQRRADRSMGHARGKSLEGLIIGKPVLSPAAPNTASSFGPPGPAPWPSASSRNAAENGWPQSATSPRSLGPPPEMSSVALIGDASGSNTTLPGSTQTGLSSSKRIADRLPTPGPQEAMRSVAGPPPRVPHDPTDPRTWPPAAPPPLKVQAKGLPPTPRQQRAERVGSRDDTGAVARYPTPQPSLEATQPLQTQPSIESMQGARRPLQVPARYPSPAATVTTRPTPTHSPSTSQSGPSTGRFAHSPRPSQSGGDRAVHSPSSSIGRYAHSPTSSQSGPARLVPSPAQIQTGSVLSGPGRSAHSPSSSQSHSPYDAFSPASSTAPLRYPSPSETIAAERVGATRYAFPGADGGAQRLTVAAPRVGPKRAPRNEQ